MKDREMKARTGAERYLRKRLEDPDYSAAYKRAKAKIERIDALINAIDRRRQDLDLSKAELARRADIPPEAVRRLLSSDAPNPTLSTVCSLADALDLSLEVVTKRQRSPARKISARRAGAASTRPRADVRGAVTNSPGSTGSRF